MVKFEHMIEDASDKIGAKRIFGEPYEKNGVTIIPAARVMGGAGGGGGEVPAPAGEGTDAGETPRRQFGSGVGYGINGRPAGAFVIKGDEVSWLPALDVNRLVFGMQLVVIVFLFVVRSIVKTRAKTAEARFKADARK